MGKVTKVHVRRSPIHGRGVFAVGPLSRSSVVEACPALVLPTDDIRDNGTLSFYVYDWGDGRVALALGYGSLYNHSESPNAYAEIDHVRQMIIIKALRRIEAGEEVTLNYGEDYPREWA